MFTIGEVSKSFNISTRTLRYYERIGLISSIKKENYAYRTYDDETIKRIQQIIVLRKLRISLKDIKVILNNRNNVDVIDILEKNMFIIDNEINSLTVIRDILKALIHRINENVKVNVNINSLQDSDILSIVEPLSLSTIKIKEDMSVKDLNRVSESINKLQDKDVRIIYLPPSYVASIHCTGDLAEIQSGNLLHQFIKEAKLYETKPDFRHFGFNNPVGNEHGYERWVTIPQEFEVKLPFIKKKFDGGLYCAYMIYMGNFDEWSRLYEWATNNDKYELNKSVMPSCLEEHLNYINKYMGSPDDSSIQIDLLLPIMEKVK